MSGNISETGTTADIDSTNPARHHDLQHGYDGGVQDADTDIMSSTKTSSRMATDGTSSTSATKPSEESNRPRPVAQLSDSSKNGRQSSQSNLLQIPSEGSGGARRPVDTSIWDWDTPLESVGESNSYYYEPVGELLHEQRDKQPARSEFSIPHAVQTSTSHWPFPSTAVGSSNNEGGFAVPRRPGVPPSVAGNKRKSLSDREGAGASSQPDQKRVLCPIQERR